MKLEQVQITKIRTSFEKMQTKEDLLHLLNEVRTIIYGENAIPFQLNQLTWHANPKLAKKRYHEFKIKKKSGEDRVIHSPKSGLKSIQKSLSFLLQCIYNPNSAAMGFVRERSIVDNAKMHVGNRYVFNIDLKDFFTSIDQARVWKTIQCKPFFLNNNSPSVPMFMKWEEFKIAYLNTNEPIEFFEGKKCIYTKTPIGTLFADKKFDPQKDKYVLFLGNSLKSNTGKMSAKRLLLVNEIKNSSRLEIANIIASLCCTEMEVERINSNGEWEKVKRNVLPQGAPTSPVITNIVCQKLDYLLSSVAKRFGLKYSRYADDITFSSMHNVYQPESEFIREVKRIIAEQNFTIKESKTRLQKDGYRKEVTGLLVNEKANVQKRYIKQLRMWLYFCERYGKEKASVFFLQKYIADKGHVKNGNVDMINVISGKLNYLKMVKGSDNKQYQKLKNRFENTFNNASKLSDKLNNNQYNKISNSDFWEIILGQSFRATHNKEDFLTFNNKYISSENTIPVLHYPKKLVTLLKKFSENNSVLKYTTHSWDSGRDSKIFQDLREFLSMARSQYGEFSNELIELSPNLNGKIYNFLFNKDISETGWGDNNPKKRIKFGWSSPELLHACDKDNSLNPEDFILPEKYQIQRSGKTIQKFKHVITAFKNEIEVRDENSSFLNLILQKHDQYLFGFLPPDISNLENKTFYTDIQWLSKAFDLIYTGIQDRPQHPNVEYFVNENSSEKIVFNILQKGSFKKGTTIFDEKLNLTRGDFGPIKNYLKNLCDWSIESEFAEGAYRINYLVSDNNIPAHEKINSADGFKHILTFYK